MDTPLSLQSFDQNWTLDDTRAYLNVKAIAPDYKSPDRADWNKQLYFPMRERLHAAFAGHLLWLGGQGKLGKIEHADACDVAWIRQWNTLAEGETLPMQQAWKTLVRPFTRKLAMSMERIAPSRLDPESVHQAACEEVATGSWEFFDLDQLPTCQHTGHSLAMAFNQWQCTLGFAPTGDSAFTPLKAGDLRAPGVECVELPAPSGQLLVGEFFLPEIQEKLQAFAQTLPSLESLHGVCERSRAMAQLGIGFVWVGDFGPEVVVSGSTVQLGYLPEEEIDERLTEGLTYAGHVSMDKSFVMLADRAVLLELLSQNKTPQEAEQQLAAYLEHRSGSMELSVAPGQYQLYFAGDSKVFEARFSMEECDVGHFDEPMCVLSAKALTPKVSARATLRP